VAWSYDRYHTGEFVTFGYSGTVSRKDHTHMKIHTENKGSVYVVVQKLCLMT